MFPMTNRTESAPDARRRGRRPLEAGLLLVLLLAAAGCSSDDPGGVGMDLVDTRVDVLLDAVDVTDIPDFRAIPIKDPDIPLQDQEVLYLGEQEGNASSFLVQYDLDAVLNEQITLDLFTQANIASVNLRLLMLSAYSIPDSTSQADPAWSTYYQVYHLEEPVDTTAFPGEDPSVLNLPNRNTNYIKDDATRVNIPIWKGDLVAWMNDGGLHDFLVREGAGSEPGLVGYSSMDMKHGGSTLDPTIEFDALGPALLVNLVEPDTVLTIAPSLDLSTFHSVAAPPDDPTDGLIVRTGLRSYPALRFDMSVLPDDVFVNRAVLQLTNDVTRSWGTLESIVVSELDVDLFGAPGDSLGLDELAAAVHVAAGMTSLDPTYHERMEFNVTTSLQRLVNGAYEGERGFILTPGEDFLAGYDLTTLDPDFYFNQFRFFGTAADDTLRPRLKITYSLDETVQGGGK